MDQERISQKFEAIGAQFTSVGIPEPRYGYEAAAPYSLSVVKDHRGREKYELGVTEEARQHLGVNVSSVDKHKKLLLLSVRLFQEYRQYLCGCDHGRYFVKEVPPGTGGGMRQALDALEAQGKERLVEEEKRLAASTPHLKKKRRDLEVELVNHNETPAM